MNWFKSLNITVKLFLIVGIIAAVWEIIALIVPEIWTISEGLSYTGQGFIFIVYFFGALVGHAWILRSKAAGKIELIIFWSITAAILGYSIAAIWLHDPVTNHIKNYLYPALFFGIAAGGGFWYRRRPHEYR